MVQSKGEFPSALFVPLHSACSKRLRVVQSAHDKDEGNWNPDMSKNKNSTSEKQAQRQLGARECIYTRFYTEKEFIHTCTEESAYVCSHKKLPPFPPSAVYYWP